MKKNVVFWVGVKNKQYSKNMVDGSGWTLLKVLGILV